ncbi:MAG: PAS domain-containing protein, partial [Desulfovibrionaceae bacterium]|nr:PAS domain-containing protein [Desulfovibrionaceae bacterium]
MINTDAKPAVFSAASEVLAQRMLDALPMCALCWDEEYTLIACNEEAVRRFGLSSKQEYLDRFFELSPERQPGGEVSKDLAMRHVKDAFEKGYLRFEWLHRKLDGEPLPVEVTLRRVACDGVNIVVGFARDVRGFEANTATMREEDERTQLMFDATPLCCCLFDKNFNKIACNQEAADLFELPSKQDYLDKFFELSPEYQPCGRPTKEMAYAYLRKAFEEGYCRFEWMHQKLNGELMPAEIIAMRLKHRGEYIVAAYTRDLREYKKMMRAIAHKDALLLTVNNVAAILLKSEGDEFEKDLWRCMGMMAEVVHVDRVYIWKNHIQDGRLYSTQMYEWSEGAEPQQGGEYTVDISYSENIPGWEETLSQGHCINTIVNNLSAEEQAQLSPQGILSILVVPVILQDTFWGFVGFDDCHNERLFSEDEEAILRSGSLLIATALLRHEIAQKMQAASAKMKAVIENYTGIIWSVDKNNTITLFNGLYLKELGVTPDFLEGKN